MQVVVISERALESSLVRVVVDIKGGVWGGGYRVQSFTGRCVH